MPRELLIIGTGGLAKEAAQLARRIDPESSRWHRFAYVTHDAAERGQPRLYGRVEHLDDEVAQGGREADVVLGVGHPKVRHALAQRLAAVPGLAFPNLIHPRVTLDTDCVSLGVGNFITEGVVMTCDIRIGDFNLLNWNVTVGHDAQLGSWNVVNPGAAVSGHVHIGDRCLLGTGARVLERLQVASDAIIGAGAVVTRSITSAGTYVGMPARPIAS